MLYEIKVFGEGVYMLMFSNKIVELFSKEFPYLRLHDYWLEDTGSPSYKVNFTIKVDAMATVLKIINHLRLEQPRYSSLRVETTKNGELINKEEVTFYVKRE